MMVSPRKTNRVPVTPNSAYRENVRPAPSLPRTVQIVVMVQHPEGIQAGNSGFLSLLASPPTRNRRLPFHRVMQHIEIGLQKPPVSHIELHRFSLSGSIPSASAILGYASS